MFPLHTGSLLLLIKLPITSMSDLFRLQPSVDNHAISASSLYLLTGDWIESARQSPSGFCQKRHHQKSNFCCRFRVASGHVFTVQFYSLSTNITQCLNEELSNVSTSRKSIWIHIRPKTSISLALVPNLLI